MKKSRGRRGFLFICLGILLFAAAAWGGNYWRQYMGYQNAVAEIACTLPELLSIPDGVYTGECDVGVLYAQVEVTVEDGLLRGIELLDHRNEWDKAAQSIQQGAADVSDTLREAVDNALAGVLG